MNKLERALFRVAEVSGVLCAPLGLVAALTFNDKVIAATFISFGVCIISLVAWTMTGND